MTNDEKFLQKAIDLALENIKTGGGPFGAVLVTEDGTIYEGVNRVTVKNDPTAHAEVELLRNALEGEIARLNIKNPESFTLKGAELYTSCEPCPMCLGAATWAGVDTVYYGATQHNADDAGFDDAEFYKQLENPNIQRIDFSGFDDYKREGNNLAISSEIKVNTSAEDSKPAHILDQAPIRLIQNAAKAKNSFDLESLTLFFEDKPCQFVIGAILWSRASYASYFFDEEIDNVGAASYNKLRKPDVIHLDIPTTNDPFDFWETYSAKIEY